ncbi:MAG: acyltransferase [Saprospiraceae bacterium]|nr:acyltransferase [Saprospiraceae bacterium]
MDRNKSIDALRGIAAIMVMVLHVGTSFLQLPGIKKHGDGLIDFLSTFDLGRIGITIFFIISGFVICKSIRGLKLPATKRFLMKRFFRLYPLFWFSMLAGLIFIWYINDRDISPSLILANATMLPALFGEDFIIGLYWTLETELFFYLLVVIFFLAGGLRNPTVLVITTLFLYLILGIFNFVPQVSIDLPHWRSTPYHLSLMIYGILFRYWYDQDSDTSGSYQYLSVAQGFFLQSLIIIFVPIAVFLRQGLNPGTELVSDAIAYLTGISMFAVGLYLWKRPTPFFSYLGKISYSIYLMHPVVLYTVLFFAERNEILGQWHISVYLIICSIFSIAVAHFTYKWIEEPFNQRGHEKADKIREGKFNESTQ